MEATLTLFPDTASSGSTFLTSGSNSLGHMLIDIAQELPHPTEAMQLKRTLDNLEESISEGDVFTVLQVGLVALALALCMRIENVHVGQPTSP